ncbi:aspartate-semialdehyde dehydrogenase [Rhodobacterales bacterium HTCC2654]|uniref:Aspartate-semialdehyde dehydrogenase n=1 Tax=Maritimibacter alkaliphilus HTCC2654 TaxID=314271 RepID=A3VBM7_9RHOB|nr:aspartate-semialdehyde dehydrogenase [Rhodobacterales bacterium HTCC2654] [Maritimibacter alkaliphilus HTCC2654]
MQREVKEFHRSPFVTGSIDFCDGTPDMPLILTAAA